MQKLIFSIFLVLCALSFTSCNRYIKSGMGGSTDVTLNRNSDEYTIKRLKPIEMDGKALFGIPGLGENNRNRNKGGLIFKFNGIELGRTPRFLPILTMAGFSFAYTSLTQSLIKKDYDKMINSNGTIKKTLFFNNDVYSENFGRLKFPFAALLGVPIAGATNNLLWSGNAASGLTNQMYYRLVDENPDVDIFTNPKYTIDYKQGIFKQSATIKANVMGATLKLK
jgi:hypothetical protein